MPPDQGPLRRFDVAPEPPSPVQPRAYRLHKFSLLVAGLFIVAAALLPPAVGEIEWPLKVAGIGLHVLVGFSAAALLSYTCFRCLGRSRLIANAVFCFVVACFMLGTIVASAAVRPIVQRELERRGINIPAFSWFESKNHPTDPWSLTNVLPGHHGKQPPQIRVYKRTTTAAASEQP